MDADVIVVGAGLAGLVTANRAVARGRRVIVLDAEPTASLGGQAWWSFGGLLLVDSPEQRRLGVRDSPELAFSDWLGSARFARGADRGEGPDRYGYAWAQRYIEFAAGPMREWLHGLGVRWFPLVQWAERHRAALPRHLGHRAGDPRAVRLRGDPRPGRRAARVPIPTPGGRTRARWRSGLGGHGGAGADPRSESGRPRRAEHAGGDRG